jgi:hypothetical protein
MVFGERDDGQTHCRRAILFIFSRTVQYVQYTTVGRYHTEAGRRLSRRRTQIPSDQHWLSLFAVALSFRRVLRSPQRCLPRRLSRDPVALSRRLPVPHCNDEEKYPDFRFFRQCKPYRRGRLSYPYGSLHVALRHCDCRPRNSSSPRPRQPFPSQYCNVFQKRMVYRVPLQSFTLAQD